MWSADRFADLYELNYNPLKCRRSRSSAPEKNSALFQLTRVDADMFKILQVMYNLVYFLIVKGQLFRDDGTTLHTVT